MNIAHPTNSTNKNAKLGFCSFIIKARKVVIKAIPTIFKISILIPSPSLEIKILILFFEINHRQWKPLEIKYIKIQRE